MKHILVSEETFDESLRVIRGEMFLSLDLETQGLKSYRGDKFFSAIIGTEGAVYYFDYNEFAPSGHEARSNSLLPRETAKDIIALLSDPRRTVFFANGKFDLRFLSEFGEVDIASKIHDVLVGDRLLFNDHTKYSLAEVASRNGHAKSDLVEEYIKEHKLWHWVKIPGKQKRDKEKYYHLVPFDLMFNYGCIDGEITRAIGMKQIKELDEAYPKGKSPRRTPLTPQELEFAITPVCYRMEHHGMLIDTAFCEERSAHHGQIYERAARAFHDQTGVKFVDSGKVLAPLFEKMGLTVPRTEKGRYSITDKWLSTLDLSFAKEIQTYREHAKAANTYYRNYLWYKDARGYLHADAKQSGTRTMRFSYADPNLQNVTDGEVRKAFPAPPGFCFVSIDFDQQEYITMLDYAGQMDVISAILNDKLDVHTATAKMMGVDRKHAKTLNFLLLYGGGVVKLALALFPVTLGEEELWAVYKTKWGQKVKKKEKEIFDKIPKEVVDANEVFLEQAEALRSQYFEKLPQIKAFIDNVIDATKDRGYISTWTGRKMFFARERAYKAPNALIQGGCADIGKQAILKVDELLKNTKSRLVLPIHDELIFYVHESELGIIPKIKAEMESVFPYKHIPLTCSVSHSWTNWSDLKDGLPSEERDHV